jgi:beta-lactam-binding protein with PASTA domain
VTPGTVISTLPVAGQSVDKGATVTLVIARAAPRDSPVAPPPLPPSGTGTVTPWTAGPRPTASSTGSVPPTPPNPFGAPSGAAAVAPPTPAAPPAPTVLSGDALIGHLYDNAHGGR